MCMYPKFVTIDALSNERVYTRFTLPYHVCTYVRALYMYMCMCMYICIYGSHPASASGTVYIYEESGTAIDRLVYVGRFVIYIYIYFFTGGLERQVMRGRRHTWTGDSNPTPRPTYLTSSTSVLRYNNRPS